MRRLSTDTASPVTLMQPPSKAKPGGCKTHLGCSLKQVHLCRRDSQQGHRRSCSDALHGGDPSEGPGRTSRGNHDPPAGRFRPERPRRCRGGGFCQGPACPAEGSAGRTAVRCASGMHSCQGLPPGDSLLVIRSCSSGRGREVWALARCTPCSPSGPCDTVEPLFTFQGSEWTASVAQVLSASLTCMESMGQACQAVSCQTQIGSEHFCCAACAHQVLNPTEPETFQIHNRSLHEHQRLPARTQPLTTGPVHSARMPQHAQATPTQNVGLMHGQNSGPTAQTVWVLSSDSLTTEPQHWVWHRSLLECRPGRAARPPVRVPDQHARRPRGR